MFSKYERGEVIQSVAMNQLPCLLDAVPEALSTLEGRKTTRKAPRRPTPSTVRKQTTNETGCGTPGLPGEGEKPAPIGMTWFCFP